MKDLAVNRKAHHDYFIEQKLEAGLVLEGWEVKAIRANRLNISEGHLHLRNGELWLINSHISPITTTSTHQLPDPTRSRKLLLHASELKRLIGKVERAGYTLVPLKVYLKQQYIKITIALGRGKKLYDKRHSIKEREWNRTQQRLMRHSTQKGD